MESTSSVNNTPLSPCGEETFQLVWHNYQSNFHEVVADLLSSEAFADVSLVAEGRLLRAHRLVLSACSPYLHNVLRSLPPAPTTHPVLLMPPEVSLPTMQALLDFMYRGVVHVPHAALVAVLHAGDILQVCGLCRGDELQRSSTDQVSSSPSAGLNHTPSDISQQGHQIGTHLKHHIRRKKRRENVQQRNETPDNTDYVPHGAIDNEHANEFGTMGNIKIKEEPQDWSVETQFTSQNHSSRNESIFRETVLNSNKQEMTGDSDDEEPTPLTCEQCHEVFPRAAAWVRHLQIHPPVAAPQNTSTTHVQEKVCAQPLQNDVQARVYTVVRKPHICGQCGKRFSSRASLGIHGRTHTGETPYTCDLCHKGFNVKSNLLRHLRTLHNRIVSPSDVDILCN